MTKVVLDVDSVLQPLTGIGWYARMLALHLPGAAENLELRLMSRHGFQDDLPAPQAPALSTGSPNWARRLRHLRYPRVHVPLLSDWGLNRRRRNQQHLMSTYGGWLFHGTNYCVPEFDGPAIATFHDMTILSHPQFHPPVRVRRMTQQIEHAVERCSLLLTVSDFSRGEISRLLGVGSDRIRVTPLAPRPGFMPRAADETAALLDGLGLQHDRYILFCGTIEPRKNIPLLLRAYSRLPAAVRRNWPLVIAGGTGWNSADIHQQILEAERRGDVCYTGYLHDDHLRHLFSGASVVVLPSVTEGFGLPVVEAMASGVPVMCSRAGSLPEVAGELSACFDPHRADMLADKLLEVLEDGNLRARMIEDGLQRAASYSWQRCAEETLHCYAHALN